jgi:plastocyanin
VRLSACRTGLATAALVLATAVAVSVLAGVGGSKQATPKTKLVQVRDDYFAPELIKVRRGGRAKWDWGAGPTDAHDVALYKGPRGVKKGKFRSPVASAPFTFARTFRKAGTYRFWCTLHSDVMRMQVRVRR